MRITNRMMVDNLMYNLQRNMARLDRSNQELATGKKYILPEENPIGSVLSMKFRAKITESQQFQRNIDDGIQWLEMADSTLDNGLDILNRVKQLTVYGATDSLVQSDRDAIAWEINELINNMLTVANTEFKGDYIFSGLETANEPFGIRRGVDEGQTPDVLTHDWRGGGEDRLQINRDNVTEVVYNGNNGSIIRQVQARIDMVINDPGSDVFMSSTHSIKSGTMAIEDSYSVLNGSSNFAGTLNPLFADGTFSLGLEGGNMTTISYNGQKDTIIDIVNRINEKVQGIKASYEKVTEDGNTSYRLTIEAKEPGKEIILEDSTQEKKVISRRSIGADTTDPGGWYGIFGFGDGPADDDEVTINGVQFVLGDYANIEDFMTGVKYHPTTGIESFDYNQLEDKFSITVKSGRTISLQHGGTHGFFSEGISYINNSGDLMEKMGMLNQVKSQFSIPKTTPLENFGIKSGDIEFNGAKINFDAHVDNLETIVDKINTANVGIKAKLVEFPVDASLPADQRQYSIILESTKPGEMKLYDRDTDFLKNMGLQDENSLKLPNYAQITDPDQTEAFKVLIDIRDHLFSGDRDSLSGDDLEKLDKVLNRFLQVRARIGARINSMEKTQKKVNDVEFNTTSLLSKVEDVDLAETIMRLSMQENVYKSALSSGARVIQPSLLDYM